LITLLLHTGGPFATTGPERWVVDWYAPTDVLDWLVLS
jgi:hypothetical protein